ncbi:MAG: hydrogenase maturation protease [Deltaproteobacteria bacterium]|nr:hydrogenase maturation protease [Deltaproteobacteria bacterium]
MPARTIKKTLLLGIGNILLSDEGLGVRAIESVREGYDLPKGVECLDGGVAGLSLLPAIEASGHLIIIDALVSDRPPGTLERVEWGKAKEAKASALAATAHQIGARELLALAEFEGRLPPTVIIGMVPLDTAPGSVLSSLVSAAMPRLVAAIIGELERFGHRIKKRRTHA